MGRGEVQYHELKWQLVETGDGKEPANDSWKCGIISSDRQRSERSGERSGGVVGDVGPEGKSDRRTCENRGPSLYCDIRRKKWHPSVMGH